MSERLSRFQVDRIPSTAAAKNTVGYEPTRFSVIAESEGQALWRAKDMSAYDTQHFSWRVRGVEELTPAEMGATNDNTD